MEQKNKPETKFIFITGGVFSSLGKGVVAASIGCILTDLGYNVVNQKWDPYLNVDPGTMSPYQHGEVFVTVDGFETDLDLGNYERFLRKEVSNLSSVTAGKVYNELIVNERRGAYLGKTIQVIPDLTNIIKKKLWDLVNKTHAEFVIVEVGGTVGDIESIPFLEVIRQLIGEQSITKNVLVIHCAPLIFLKNTNEYKTKPLQHSIRTLSSCGIIADLLVVRSDAAINSSLITKISFMCNVNEKNIFKNPDLSSTYFLPEILFDQKIHHAIFRHFGLSNERKTNIDSWRKFTAMIKKPKQGVIKVGLVGKYTLLRDAYISIVESLKIASYELNLDVQINWIDARSVSKKSLYEQLDCCDGILVPGGFGNDGTKFMLLAIEYARIQKKPFLGICLGMQLACIEFTRNVLKLADANTSEFATNKKSNNLIFSTIDHADSFGGTLRLGDWKVMIKANTRAYDIYKQKIIFRRHRHRYAFNDSYTKLFEDQGFIFSGQCISKTNKFKELFELNNHPFFMGCQYHPEFSSKPLKCEPLFREFLRAIFSVKNK